MNRKLGLRPGVLRPARDVAASAAVPRHPRSRVRRVTPKLLIVTDNRGLSPLKLRVWATPAGAGSPVSPCRPEHRVQRRLQPRDLVTYEFDPNVKRARAHRTAGVDYRRNPGMRGMCGDRRVLVEQVCGRETRFDNEAPMSNHSSGECRGRTPPEPNVGDVVPSTASALPIR